MSTSFALPDGAPDFRRYSAGIFPEHIVRAIRPGVPFTAADWDRVLYDITLITAATPRVFRSGRHAFAPPVKIDPQELPAGPASCGWALRVYYGALPIELAGGFPKRSQYNWLWLRLRHQGLAREEDFCTGRPFRWPTYEGPVDEVVDLVQSTPGTRSSPVRAAVVAFLRHISKGF